MESCLWILWGTGGESIHKSINNLKRYNTIKKDTDRLEYTMNQHLLSCHPTPKQIQPKKVPRNLKRKFSEDIRMNGVSRSSG